MIRSISCPFGFLRLGLGLGLALVGFAGPASAAGPKVGDKAPGFLLPGSDGKTYSLDQFKGKKAVVIAWFPKAFTPGCTAECKSFRANGDHLKPLNVAYFAASIDTSDENKKFAEMYGLDFPILSDPGTEVARAYGVIHDTRKVAERWTFYIDKDGIIRAIDKKITPKQAGLDLASKIKELGLGE
jgi:peroxiredoxin Q/BCP